MLVIRLKRIGKKHQPSYRIVVSEKHKDTRGDYLEKLGFYNPRVKPRIVQLNEERIKYWLSQGAQVSDTVYNLLVDAHIVPGPKRKAVHLKKKVKKEEKGEETGEKEVSTENKEVKEEEKTSSEKIEELEKQEKEQSKEGGEKENNSEKQKDE